MKKLEFTVKINAPAAKVWSSLWNDETYRKWTSAFSEGSHAESDWKEGSRILFLDGKGDGMFSLIDNCREAMTFYKQCLGGELTFQTIGESPMAAQMPAVMKDRILHATLINDELTIMASDMVDEKGLVRGNSISLMLDLSSENEIR